MPAVLPVLQRTAYVVATAHLAHHADPMTMTRSQKLDGMKCVCVITCGHWFAAQQAHAVMTTAISVVV